MERTLHLVFEPGVATLAGDAEQPAWGIFGGLSVAIGLTPLLAIGVHADRKTLIDRPDHAGVATWGVGFVYTLDLADVRPFGEIGLGGVHETFVDQPSPPAALAVSISIGVDVSVWRWLIVGAVFRYYAYGERELLDPGSANLALRVGARLPLTY